MTLASASYFRLQAQRSRVYADVANQHLIKGPLEMQKNLKHQTQREESDQIHGFMNVPVRV